MVNDSVMALLNCADEETEWHAWKTACRSASGVCVQKRIPMEWADEPRNRSQWENMQFLSVVSDVRGNTDNVDKRMLNMHLFT